MLICYSSYTGEHKRQEEVFDRITEREDTQPSDKRRNVRTGQSDGAQANVSHQNTGARPKEPEAPKTRKRLINNISEATNEDSYNEFKIPNV